MDVKTFISTPIFLVQIALKGHNQMKRKSSSELQDILPKGTSIYI